MTTNSPLVGTTMTVIGGGQGWGAKIAATAKRIGMNVHIVEVNTTSAEQEKMINDSNSVFFAAPDNVIPDILQEVRPLLVGKSILDCATNKGSFADDLIALSQETSVCSTHPMVRSETLSRGQNVLIMPLGNQSDAATSIAEELYSALEMRLQRYDFLEHDNLAIVQLLPHLTQRMMIDVLGHLLQDMDIDLEDVHTIAPANFRMLELAIGRCGTQRSDVSSGIIAESLKSPLGKKICTMMIESLQETSDLSTDREALTQHFKKSMHLLDDETHWREHMEPATDMQIEAMGNFDLCSLRLEVTEDAPGLLEKICHVFAECGLNMNAIHSHAIETDDKKGVVFNIGIDDLGTQWEKLEKLCTEHGWKLEHLRK